MEALMMHLRCGVLAVLFAAFCTPVALAQSNNWWNDSPWVDPSRGFNWYPPDQPPAKAPSQAIKPPANIRDLTSVDAIQQELKRLRDRAIMDPTPRNLHDYLDANQYVQNRAAVFADTWRRVVWQNPDVDYNARNPVANFAQTAMKEDRTNDERKLLATLGQDHGLIFFYRSDCQYCHLQAPILQALRQQYNIDVLAISMDGGPINEFPNAKPDNGISMVVTQGKGIETVPALFLVSNDEKSVVPLGSGVIAMDDIVNRIRVLVTTKPGENF